MGPLNVDPHYEEVTLLLTFNCHHPECAQEHTGGSHGDVACEMMPHCDMISLLQRGLQAQVGGGELLIDAAVQV